MKALYQKIRSLQGKNYGLYKSLADRSWDFGDFVLDFLHVQGDPYAPASRIMIKSSLQMLGYPSEWGGTFERRLALSDFLFRRLGKVVREKYPGKDASIVFDAAGPEMLVRNSLWVDNGELRACLQVRLPGDGRKIQAEDAAEILTMVLPDLVSAGLYNSYESKPEGVEPELLEYYRVLAERKEILSQLEERGLCAFVPDRAVLPRASGLSELPMDGAVPFKAPAEMEVTLDVCGREIRGMGIPKGITVITGGAFHGKSTLLQALTKAVYPHVPGDGREGIVISESAVRVGVEDGRSVRGTDLSPFVRDLPGGISTKNFTTACASGSTSEAANLMEAMEAGSDAFLIDEDSSAVNFLIRDVRVRKLLGDDREPLIPLTDRIREIQGRSFILVAGACGDFLDLADNIIVMTSYKAECARINGVAAGIASGTVDGDSTDVAAKIVPGLPTFVEPQCRSFAEYVKPLLPGLRPASAVERQVKVKISGDTLLQIGFLVSDTSKAGALVDRQQRFGAGFMLLNLCQNAASNNAPVNGSSNNESSKPATIMECINALCEKIRNVGFRNLPQGMSREMSLPRAIDIACVLYRLRG
ncbi:ABC-ATPase domain-containing protein [Fibrobacter sp.]|uniref:ABC-ATPase domain-containing protein n=1 Tax=Fibrobacter sp. TaxID=35828 RepID=UPI0025BC390F|nr:ABC-ATPase domain-containing protein [Fibrobacter sp.]